MRQAIKILVRRLQEDHRQLQRIDISDLAGSQGLIIVLSASLQTFALFADSLKRIGYQRSLTVIAKAPLGAAVRRHAGPDTRIVPYPVGGPFELSRMEREVESLRQTPKDTGVILTNNNSGTGYTNVLDILLHFDHLKVVLFNSLGELRQIENPARWRSAMKLYEGLCDWHWEALSSA